MKEPREYNNSLAALKTMQFLVPHKNSALGVGLCNLRVKGSTQVVALNDVVMNNVEGNFVHLDKTDKYVSTSLGINFKESAEQIGLRFMYKNEIIRFCKSKQLQDIKTSKVLQEIFNKYLKYLEEGKICRKSN